MQARLARSLIKSTYTLLITVACASFACQHKETECELPDYASAYDDPTVLKSWLEYMSDLEEYSADGREAGLELLQRPPQGYTDEDLRYGLALALHQYRKKNYSKAAEVLSQLANKKSWSPDIRASLRIAAHQLIDMTKLEKELQAERKQRQQLERKLKALSEIEREISERDKKSNQ